MRQNHLCLFAVGKDAQSVDRASLPRHGFSLLGNLDSNSLELSPALLIIWVQISELKVKIKNFCFCAPRTPLWSPLPWDDSSVGISGELTTSSPTSSLGIGDRTVAHKLQLHQAPGGLVKTQIPGFPPQSFGFSPWGEAQDTCIASKLPSRLILQVSPPHFENH